MPISLLSLNNRKWFFLNTNKVRSIFKCIERRSYSSDLQNRQIKPPALFQDINKQPLPYHILKQQQQQQQQQQQNIQHIHQIDHDIGIRENLSIFGLFKNKYTRGSAFKLFLLLSITQVVVFYISSNAILEELEDTENKLTDLWDFYERKDISQTVMAVHIGQLKQQLLDVGIKPVTSKQALMVAQHLLSFARDKESGNLMIYVDPKSSIFKLVPFNYEYDINKVPRLDTAAEETWEEYNKGTKEA